jgi:hypothetical protein
MGARFGDIDVNQILENEFRLGVLEKLYDGLLANNAGSLILPSPENVKQIKSSVVEELKKKYPNSGLKLT